MAAIGCGYDLTTDLRFSGCKAWLDGSRLIYVDGTETGQLVLPGGVVVGDVPRAIKADKGERTRFRSDVISFNQMTEQFNHDLSLSGKIPSGTFNTMFNFSRSWQKDAVATKSLAFDGWFITLYTIELARSRITLLDDVRQDVPSSWDPQALADFIDKYGTHIVTGVKMGGKDVIYLKELNGSNRQPYELQRLLKDLADQRFSEDLDEGSKSNSKTTPRTLKDGNHGPADLRKVLATSFRPSIAYHSKNEDVISIKIRRGGIDLGCHKQWVTTIADSPNVISMSFVPITSLLKGVQGCGFLSHAINLYLRYKPPIEELAEFLDFQLPRQWAPAYGNLPLALCRKKNAAPSLQYAFMGPKLYINTEPVDTGGCPVTGIRLFLEGKRNDHLAIHLQHLSVLPKNLLLSDDNCCQLICHAADDRKYLEPIKWGVLSHICTAIVEHNSSCVEDTASIVTKAWLEVKGIGMKKVLFLRLGFSMVAAAKLRRSEWEAPSSLSQKSGIFSSLISGRISQGLSPPQNPPKPDINSALFTAGPPKPVGTGKFSSIVDTREMVRGPEDHPGYWVVTGARLCIEGGKITIKAKYSLLTIMSDYSGSL